MEFEKGFELKTRQVYFIQPIPRWPTLKNLKKRAALFFFAQADNLSKKNPYFGKHLFRKTRTLSSTPLRGCEIS